MRLILHPYNLRLKYRFRIAHDSRDIQRTLIVELNDGEISGFGEATASRYYDHTIEDIVALLERNRGIIEEYDYQDPSIFWEQLKPEMSQNSFAQSALDVAVHDLFAKRQGKSLTDLWGGQPKVGPNTNYTIGIDTIEKMSERLLEFPWPLYKIKLGTDYDMAIIRALRKITDAPFRIDANCGWEVEEAMENLAGFRRMGVELVEQPLPPDNWAGMKLLYEKSEIPLIADESVMDESQMARCTGHFHGINIKLMKCGGFTPARQMIAQARKLGLKVMAGCMTESSVGIAGLAQLKPWLDYADMDGSSLVVNDIAHGPTLRNGVLETPHGPGIGIDRIFQTID